jgi:2-dehydro-3-deoxyphosphogalactonate aldolase
MTATEQFNEAFEHCPLIAILRGVRPDEVKEIGTSLVEAGFTIIEVPLNSPEPFESISRLARAFAGRAVVGAGTVLRVEDVTAVAKAGGSLTIAPNTDVRVISAAVNQGLVAVPGFMTPSEGLSALAAGAAALKLFPAEASSPAILAAMRAILPKDTRVLPVGGIAPSVLGSWRAAGAAGFGLGSALYKPGSTASEVAVRARAFIEALRSSG